MAKQSFFSLNELLASPRLKPIIERLQPAAVIATIKGVYEDISQEMFSAASERRIPELAELTEKVLARLQTIEETGNSLVIEGEGILFPGGVLTSPLGRSLLDEMIWRIDVPDSDFDLVENGGQIDRDGFIGQSFPNNETTARSLCSLFGVEDALLFSSPETAEIAVFKTFGHMKPILLARRDLYEDLSRHRLSDRLSFASASFCEVGAANQVRLADFLDVCQEEKGMVWLASQTHSDLVPTLNDDDLLALKEKIRPWNIPLVFRADFAPIFDLSEFFLSPQPTVFDFLAKDIDLLLLGGSQLLGGPHCGILLGAKRFIDPIRQNRLDEIFSPHRADLSGMAKLISLCRNRENAFLNIPILQTVSGSLANLKNRAERLIPQLSALSSIDEARMENCETLLYPKSERVRLKSIGIFIRFKTGTPKEWQQKLLMSKPGMKIKVLNSGILIDLKTIPPALDPVIVQIFEKI